MLLSPASVLSTSSSGTAAVAASWPAFQVWAQDGGEGEALLIQMAYGERDQETKSTGLPV